MVPPARGYDPPDYYQPLRGDRVVQPAGMMSSVPCREPVFRPSRHRGASYTMATWLLRDQSQPKWLTEGRGWVGEEGGGWKTASEGEISSLRRMRERLEGWRMGGRGGGGEGVVDRGRRQVRFLIKADHTHQP